MPKRTQALTGAQQKVMDFILRFRKIQGYPPTRREINMHFGWSSPNAASQHLRLMERKGYVRLIDNISRGIEIL